MLPFLHSPLEQQSEVNDEAAGSGGESLVPKPFRPHSPPGKASVAVYVPHLIDKASGLWGASMASPRSLCSKWKTDVGPDAQSSDTAVTAPW